MKSTHGNVSIKAFRLTPSFMSMYKEKVFTLEKLDLLVSFAKTLLSSMARFNMNLSSIVEEVPLVVHRSSLVSAFMATSYPSRRVESTSGNISSPAVAHSLTFASDPFFERNMELMADEVDDLAQEQYKLMKYLQNVSRQQNQILGYQQKRVCSVVMMLINLCSMRQISNFPSRVFPYCRMSLPFNSSPFRPLLVWTPCSLVIK